MTIKEKVQKSFDALKGEFGYKNKMEAPRLVKVVLSSGIGSVKDPKRKELIGKKLTLIAGQNVITRTAKKSIATFKVRQGDASGYQVTLRGQRMYDFLDKLVNISLPRTKDFRGLKREAVDAMGNYTIGIKENTIFPETSDEDLKDVFGFSIIVVTSKNDKKETLSFLTHLGFPFKKEA